MSLKSYASIRLKIVQMTWKNSVFWSSNVKPKECDIEQIITTNKMIIQPQTKGRKDDDDYYDIAFSYHLQLLLT
jgi:hypothetical protein